MLNKNKLKQSDLQFQRIEAKGYYANDAMILIQNRFYQNQEGYEVVTPLRIPGQDKLLLVNRGWVPKPRDGSLPSIDGVIQEVTVTGHVKLLNEYQFILGKNIVDTQSLPIVVQKLNINELSQLTHLSFYPSVIRLDASASDGFVRDWVITAGPPERHLVYAVQWFLFALILLCAYVCFCCERVILEDPLNSYAE